MTASVSAPKKLLYQILSRASTTGMLASEGASLKWVSILRAPSRRREKLEYPTARQMESPTALQSENRPPTQSHMVKTFSGAIPKSEICCALVETAAKYRAISFSEAWLRNHFLMVRALLRVSWVVNVLETTIKSVVSGFSPFRDSYTWSPSTLLTK